MALALEVAEDPEMHIDAFERTLEQLAFHAERFLGLLHALPGGLVEALVVDAAKVVLTEGPKGMRGAMARAEEILARLDRRLTVSGRALSPGETGVLCA